MARLFAVAIALSLRAALDDFILRRLANDEEQQAAS